MNYSNVDKVIQKFYSYLPNGGDFSDSVNCFKFDFKERSEIQKFLIDNSILKPWGDYSKLILTSKGENIINDHRGIEKFLEYEKKLLEKQKSLEGMMTEKLKWDTLLSRWQVKVFWYVFIFGLVGGIYTVYSIVNLALGETEEQKIERILDQKLQEFQQNQP